MKKVCRISGESFEIADDDLAFYKTFDVPPPTVCPDERARRRMAFANQRHLYHRTCAATGKKIISNYSPEKPYLVYDLEYWWSDAWNQFATGRDFDFSRPFFDQFKELSLAAPRPNGQRALRLDENSDFTNYAGKNKNCYLIFDSDKNWDCLYSYSINSSRSCVDCFRCDACELCYECVDCLRCYESTFLQDCQNCSTSAFLSCCVGCSNCFGCVNLRNKEYYFFNEPLSPSDYADRIAKLGMNSRAKRSAFLAEFRTFAKQFPRRFMQGTLNENVVGDYLVQCKNAFTCFDSRKLWDCRYMQQAFDDAKTCMDCTEVGDAAELCYESCYAGYTGYSLRFTTHALGNASRLTYCSHCPSCSDCFGCVGLHHARFAILNRQYSESEYPQQVTRIIDHMKTTGEWGEFFPVELSPFAYNETHAFDFYPLSKDDVQKRGWRWKDDMLPGSTNSAKYIPPDMTDSVTAELTSQVCSCTSCNKQYRIIAAELDFYRKLSLAPPERCWNCRHVERLGERNPRPLVSRNCDSCDAQLTTTVSHSVRERMYCEHCFQQAME